MRLIIAALLTLALAGCDKGKQDQPQEQASIARIDRSLAGQEAPATPFLGPQDQPVTLAAFRGKPLIVNLWATWCAPCLTEMPSLDRLAGQLGGKAQLIVLSVDLEGRKAVTPYFRKMEFRYLQPYLDKENVIPLAVKAAGLPVTLIYDAEGKEVLRVNGPLEWDGPKGKALVEEAVKGTSDGATT